jgi:two-component system, NarL family, sensor histidine kinase UhpB
VAIVGVAGGVHVAIVRDTVGASLIILGWGVTVGLILVALRPLRSIETAARRVWRGELDVRVPESLLADRDMARVSQTFNVMLDGLAAERARLRDLASRLIRIGDNDSARIAGTLHESTAQSLAALTWELGLLARDCYGTALAPRLTLARGLADDALEEVRQLAHTIHPQVLDDLGLVAALTQLARRASAESAIRVFVCADAAADTVTRTRLRPTESATLYWIAQEALANAMRHSVSASVAIRIRTMEDAIVLEISDDGRGFDVAAAGTLHPEGGLFMMRDRLSLAGGRLEVESNAVVGTTIRAYLPINAR